MLLYVRYWTRSSEGDELSQGEIMPWGVSVTRGYGISHGE